MIKALRCNEPGMILVLVLTVDGPKCLKNVKGKCEVTGEPCRGVPVYLYEESEHEEAQAALAARGN